MTPLTRGIVKWAACVASIIFNFLIFGDVGIVFGLALTYVICKYA